MDAILYFQGPRAETSAKIAGVRDVAAPAGVHVHVVSERPTRGRVAALAAFLRSLPKPCGVFAANDLAAAFERAWALAPSPALGATFCQATFAMMGEDVLSLVPRWKDRIFFVHFRNARGDARRFRETFHDNGALDMARLVALYRKHLPEDVPVRVDHVPAMGRSDARDGYGFTGRLFALGYLKGLLSTAP